MPGNFLEIEFACTNDPTTTYLLLGASRYVFLIDSIVAKLERRVKIAGTPVF
jgi:hypothetical protein